MRFRYFDDEGTEVELSSVDALEFRVKTGAVGPETLLYDAAVGHWAPAVEHPIYRFLTEEGGAPPPEVSAGDTAPSTPGPKPDAPGPAPEPEASDPPGPVPGISDPPDLEPSGPGSSVPEPTGPPSAGSRSPDADPPGRESTGELPDLSFLSPSPDAGDGSGSRTAGTEAGQEIDGSDRTDSDAGDGGVPAGDDGAAPGGGGSAPTPEPDTGGTSLRTNWRGWGVRVDEVEIPSPLVSRSAVAGGPGSAPRSGGGTAVGKAAAVLRAVAAGLAVSAAAAVALAGLVLGLRQVDPDAILRRVELPRVEALRAAAFGGDTRGSGQADQPAAPPTEAGPAGPEVAAEPAPAEPAAATEEVRSLVPEITAAASRDLAGAMVELQRALGVAETPPDRWLDGIYLASAGNYPEVGTYWRDYGRWVAAVESMEERLFRGFVGERVRATGLDSARADALSRRVLERYERSASRREVVYRDLAALADEAVALHETLTRNQRSISYEPFSGGDLSRDPVIEAVPDDPELARRLWSRLDRIFEILDRVQGIRPVSTPRLREALLSGLTFPRREG